MEGLMRGLGLRRKKAATVDAQPVAPLARASVVPHHWLTLAVVRPGPAAPIPIPHARVIVRPFPRGAPRPEDPVARGATGPDGAFAAYLPAGRYAVYAQHEQEGKAVTVTLEHAGRATLVLESLGRRVTLTVEVNGTDDGPLPDATVDIRTIPAGTHAARAITNDDGVADIALPPGAYEVRIGNTVTRTYLEADTILRVHADPAPPDPIPAPPVSRYAQKARAATSIVAPLDDSSLREETWN